jgi:hypothetical protein
VWREHVADRQHLYTQYSLCSTLHGLLHAAGAGFVDFLIDSSGYLSRITPAMRDKLGISPTDGVAIVTGSSSSSSNSSGGSSNSGSGSSSSTGRSSNSGTSSSGSSSGRAHVKLRQRVKLPKMWLGSYQTDQDSCSLHASVLVGVLLYPYPELQHNTQGSVL